MDFDEDCGICSEGGKKKGSLVLNVFGIWNVLCQDMVAWRRFYLRVSIYNIIGIVSNDIFGWK